MSGMSSLVHEGVQSVQSRADGIRVSKRGEVSHGRYPSSISLEPSRLRPVAESIRVLVLTVKQVQVHSRSTVLNTESGVASSPLFNCLSEWEVRVKFSSHGSSHGLRGVVRLESISSFISRKSLTCLQVELSSSCLESVHNFEKFNLAKSFSLSNLVVVEINVAEGLSELVSHLDNFSETILSHKSTD